MDILSYVDVQTLLAFLVILLGCFLYLNRRTNLPPGPWGLPFIGNVFWFLKHASSPDVGGRLFMRTSRKYGDDLLYLRIGNQGLLVLHGYDAIQDFFVKNADSFSGRPYWIHPEIRTSNARGILWQSGEEWKKTRKFVLQNLREFGVGKTTLEEKILDEVDAAAKVLKHTSGEPYDVRNLARYITINVIHGIVFGRRFDYEDENLSMLLKKTDEIFSRRSFYDITTYIPNCVLKLINPDKVKQFARRKAVTDDVKNQIRNEISEHEATYDVSNIRDFIDLYIQNKQDGDEQHVFTDDNMIRIIMELFLGGTDTTANTIVWCILYMIEYPDVQTRCQEDIREAYGHQTIQWSNRTNLPYVEATILEIQRLANVADVAMYHSNEEEKTIRGYTIPRRTLILANLMSSNLDPKYWKEPETFKPERFLEDGKIKTNVAFMPFSTGPRICVGEALARMEIFLIFTNLLQRFTFKRERDDVPTSFRRDIAHIAGVPMAFKTRIVQRS